MKILPFVVLLAAAAFGIPLLAMWCLEAAHEHDPRVPDLNYWAVFWLTWAINIALAALHD